MTQYAPQATGVSTSAQAGAQRVQKVFDVLVRTELDGVYTGHLSFTVAMTGQRGSERPDTLTIDGKAATLDEVQNLYTWSQDKGRFQLTSEQAAEEVGA